mmetsp:Transcript_65501/g.191696  ORF Transcript_65501/g.191696 Transcript_65501/m.191696 type:complete len:240 (+) Transcript_65501:165-884(+)
MVGEACRQQRLRRCGGDRGRRGGDASAEVWRCVGQGRLFAQGGRPLPPLPRPPGRLRAPGPRPVRAGRAPERLAGPPLPDRRGLRAPRPAAGGQEPERLRGAAEGGPEPARDLPRRGHRGLGGLAEAGRKKRRSGGGCLQGGLRSAPLARRPRPHAGHLSSGVLRKGESTLSPTSGSTALRGHAPRGPRASGGGRRGRRERSPTAARGVRARRGPERGGGEEAAARVGGEQPVGESHLA